MVDTQLNKASAFSFELTFPVIPSETEIKVNEELVLNVFNSIIPGISMDFNEESWQGAKSKMATGGFSFEDWNVSFIVDSNFKNWKMMYKWMMFMNNNKDRYIEEQRNYSTDATLRIMDNFQNQRFSLFFVDVWPTSIGEVSMNYREGEMNLETQVSFTYDRFEIREYSVI